MAQPAYKQYIIVTTLVLVAMILSACTSTTPQTKDTSTTSQSRDGIFLVADDSGQYVPAEIRVKVGSAVRIEGDTESLVGGMDTVIIDGYSIRKKIAKNDNIIEFTASTPGTFDMYCANGMGNGKLIVE